MENPLAILVHPFVGVAALVLNRLPADLFDGSAAATPPALPGILTSKDNRHMLWPTTLRIENHWTRPGRRTASSAHPGSTEELWSGRGKRQQALPVKPAKRVDPTDAKVSRTTPSGRLSR
jgi:hypothetical protein